MSPFRTVVKEAKTEKGLGSTYYVQRFEDIDRGITFELVEHPMHIVHHKRNEVTHRKVWTCNCPDFTERKVFKNGECTHILAVQEYRQKLRDLIVSYRQNPELIFKQAFGQAEPAPLSEPSIQTMPTADLIRALVKRLNTGRQASDLWTVLTALRGPDSDDDDLKAETTSALRGLIGLDSNNGTGAISNSRKPLGYDQESYSEGLIDVENLFPASQFHFRSHYILAVRTLKAYGFKFGS